MAPQDRREVLDIRETLLAQGHRFSFVQAERLLRSYLSRRLGEKVDEESLAKFVRVRPHLSLDFPETDIRSITSRSDDPDRFHVTVTFLGLFGVSSPLPTFYTEDLMDEVSQDMTVTRDFLELINSPFYPLFLRCWSKYRQHIKIVEEEDSEYLERLFCLLGLGTEKLRESIPNAKGLLRYIGLFTQFPRSALSLKTLLSDGLGQPPIEIHQCVKRMARIPEEQRLSLGRSSAALGVDAYLGEEIADRMGAFRIAIGPLDAATFQDFFPDGEKCATLRSLTQVYLDQPLDWDLNVALARGEARTACLGGPRWCRLGWETWLFSGETWDGELGVQFAVQEEEISNIEH